VPGLVVLIVACLLIAGCSTPDTGDQTVQPTASPVAGARYTAGDIVRNPVSTASTAWLVIRFDAASDSYERALVYPNTDGSWGYRSDNRTEKAGRLVMEKVYTELVENKLPSSVPIVTPTVITTVATTAQATVSLTAVETTNTSTRPTIARIIPDKGDAGTTVQVTDLVGNNFRNGANVTLSRSGSSDITATGVRAVTPKSITCSFAIPSTATAGAWDVVVTNLDGQSDRYTNIFSVHRTASSLITTSPASAGTVPILYIDPSVGHVGNNQFTMTGSNFQKGVLVKLQKSGKPDLTARDTIWNSNTSLQCFIDIPVGSFGTWDIVVTNPDKTYGIKYEGYPIS
jgi:hypothetical protein